ncbi:hypothetical protein D3C76_1263380 [compost metagenome]
MVQLHRNLRAFAVDRVDEIAECANEPVVVNAHRVAGRAPDFPIDRGVLGDDQTHATTGPGPMVFDELVVNLAEGASELREDRCLHETVAQLQGADPPGLVERRSRAVGHHKSTDVWVCHNHLLIIFFVLRLQHAMPADMSIERLYPGVEESCFSAAALLAQVN